MKIAVACASGSAKGVFVHGVLDALYERGVPVEAYAASSSSTIPAAFAAAGNLDGLGGAPYWQRGGDKLRQVNDVSKMVKWGIAQVIAVLQANLFLPTAKRFMLTASHVGTPEAAAITQGEGAERLGLEQLRAMRARDPSWARENLVCHISTQFRRQQRDF